MNVSFLLIHPVYITPNVHETIKVQIKAKHDCSRKSPIHISFPCGAVPVPNNRVTILKVVPEFY